MTGDMGTSERILGKVYPRIVPSVVLVPKAVAHVTLIPRVAFAINNLNLVFVYVLTWLSCGAFRMLCSSDLNADEAFSWMTLEGRTVIREITEQLIPQGSNGPQPSQLEC
jgi:hypothetical protein